MIFSEQTFSARAKASFSCTKLGLFREHQLVRDHPITKTDWFSGLRCRVAFFPYIATKTACYGTRIPCLYFNPFHGTHQYQYSGVLESGCRSEE